MRGDVAKEFEKKKIKKRPEVKGKGAGKKGGKGRRK